MRWIVCFLLPATIALPQPRSREERRDPELEGIVGLARIAPPAVQAYALTRIAYRTGFSKEWRKELLTEAFEVAALAPDPYPMRLMPGLRESGPITLRARRYSQGLDRLSLQMGALPFLGLKTDPSLLERIPRPRPRPAACSDPMVPDVSGYYRALMLLSHSFPDADRRKGRDVEFYESILLSMESPVEVVPAAQMLAGIPLSQANSSKLLNRLATALSSIHGDDRSFSSSQYTLPDEIKRLTGAMADRGVDVTTFHTALKDYLVRHFRSRRCADTASDTAVTAKVAAAFELNPEVLRPIDIGDGPDIGSDREPERLFELREMWRRLQVERLSGRRSEGHATRFEQFASFLDEWTAETGQEDADFYPMKQAFLASVLVASNGQEQAGLLRKYVAFVNSMPQKPEMQPEAFAAAQFLSTILATAEPGVRQSILDSLERSGSPMPALFVQLERRSRR